MIGPILWWHTEAIEMKCKDGKTRQYTFSPIGLGDIPHEWILMEVGFYEDGGRFKCEWDLTPYGGGAKPPEMPRGWKTKLKQKVKGVKAKHWPGED